MVNVSSAFKAALAAGAPQRIALVFENAVISNEDIDVEGGVDFHEVFCSESDITIGLTPASEISFAVFNNDGFYDEFEFGTFDAYIGVRLSVVANSSAPTRRPTITVTRNTFTMTVSGNGYLETYELCPMGRFSAPRPSVIRKSLIDVMAYDQMRLFDDDMPDATELGITYPVTAGRLLQALCEQVGVQAVTYTFLNSDIQLAKKPDSFDNATMREVLAWIAQAAGANARFNRLGQLELSWLTAQTDSYNESKYTDFESVWFTVPQIDRVHVRNEDSTEETVVGSGNTTYLLQNNPFLRVEDNAQGLSVIVTPTRVTAYPNSIVTFTANVLGAANPTCNWQRSSNNVSWSNIQRTGTTYSFSASELNCSFYYRVEVVYGDEVIYSNSVKATLKEATETT